MIQNCRSLITFLTFRDKKLENKGNKISILSPKLIGILNYLRKKEVK
jgi:hypothetical protein